MSGIQRTFVRAFEFVASLAIVSVPLAQASASTATRSTEPMTAQAIAAPLLQPSTLVLVGVGLVGLAVFRTRYRDQK